jgi:hypothetical protein
MVNALEIRSRRAYNDGYVTPARGGQLPGPPRPMSAVIDPSSRPMLTTCMVSPFSRSGCLNGPVIEGSTSTSTTASCRPSELGQRQVALHDIDE